MTFQAVSIWMTKGMSDLSVGVQRSPKNMEHVVAEWITEPQSKGYISTITHTLGSATYFFENLTDGNVKITVYNSTNVASATGGNAWSIMGHNTGYVRPNNSATTQPWTNVSQTIFMIKSKDELSQLLKRYD